MSSDIPNNTTPRDPDLRGVVFAAVKPRHRLMARRAARALRRVNPDIPIDLFTDVGLEDPIFAQVHRLERVWHRPKIEALRRSRFHRTLYLDNDIIAVSDGLDILDLLDHAEMAGVHDNSRNSKNARQTAGGPVPAAFPSINSGVLAVKHSAQSQKLLSDWALRMKEHGQKVDQPALRSLLWETGLPLAIAPVEYNLMYHRLVGGMTSLQAAPRFLHVREMNQFKRDLGDPNAPHRIEEFYSARYCAQLRHLLQEDDTLQAPKHTALPPLGRVARRFIRARDFVARRNVFRWMFLLDLMRSAVRQKRK